MISYSFTVCLPSRSKTKKWWHHRMVANVENGFIHNVIYLGPEKHQRETVYDLAKGSHTRDLDLYQISCMISESIYKLAMKPRMDARKKGKGAVGLRKYYSQAIALRLYRKMAHEFPCMPAIYRIKQICSHKSNSWGVVGKSYDPVKDTTDKQICSLVEGVSPIINLNRAIRCIDEYDAVTSRKEDERAPLIVQFILGKMSIQEALGQSLGVSKKRGAKIYNKWPSVCKIITPDPFMWELSSKLAWFPDKWWKAALFDCIATYDDWRGEDTDVKRTKEMLLGAASRTTFAQLRRIADGGNKCPTRASLISLIAQAGDSLRGNQTTPGITMSKNASLVRLAAATHEWHQENNRQQLMLAAEKIVQYRKNRLFSEFPEWCTNAMMDEHVNVILDEGELVALGITEKHCVGMYVQQMQEQKSVILAIDLPDHPRVTMEVGYKGPTKVKQAYAVGNTKPHEAVMAYHRRAAREWIQKKKCTAIVPYTPPLFAY